jgi:arabinofuranan 3-O-arabinosyltransferase
VTTTLDEAGADAPEGGASPPPPVAEPVDGLGTAPPVGRGELLVLVLGALGLAAAVIGTRWGVFTPDTRPDLYQDPGSFLRESVSAWVAGSSGMGQGNFNAGAAPVAAVVWVIRSLGASPWLAIRIWRLVLLLIGAWGIRRYLGTVLGRRLTVSGRLIATVFWVANPYVIVSGSTTPILLPYVLLPWAMLAFVRATREPRSWRWPALFALAFFAQTGLNAGVVPFFQLLALPAHVAFARWVEGRSWGDLWRVVRRCGVACVGVSLYWLLPSFLAAGTGAGIATATEDPVDVARTSSYAESARLLGNWPLYGRAGDRLFLGDYTIYLTSAPVLIASFLVPLAAGIAMWRSRTRERLLVVGLLATALPIMVGLFPPDDPYPAGRFLAAVFEAVPATMAFRTTNKVGAVVVLAQTLALVLGWRAWQSRARQARRPLRVAAIAAVVLVLVGLSAPMWNGGLYPLGYTVPDSWERATADLDARADGDPAAAARVLVLPGGTGGNYRWGMRSPDDLFPSLLDRPVAVRNTVVGRGDPTGNLLSAFDTAVAQGGAGDRAISTAARYLGASDVLVRNDLLVEEIGGPAGTTVVRQTEGDVGLSLLEQYGRRGQDTVPGGSGRPTEEERETDPSNARLRPLRTYEVAEPIDPIRLAAAADQVLVVGDGEALVPLADAGLVDGRQPLRFLGDLDDEAFAEAVAQGGRIVLTDTNRRRAWDINRTTNATSPTLGADEDIDQGNGATTTRWPDDAADQTVVELLGVDTSTDETGDATGREAAAPVVGADAPAFGLHPFGRPSNAFDGDPSTAWITGGFNTAEGSSIWIELPEPRRIEQLRITTNGSEPSSIAAVRVRVGDRQVIEAVAPGQTTVDVRIAPGSARRIEVTILDQTPGSNPVGISEIEIDGVAVRALARIPTTLDDLAEGADAATVERLAELPLDVVLRRARGAVGDPSDDEEAQLDRRFSLPGARELRFSAELAVSGADPTLVAAAREGDTGCQRVALLDGDWIEARIVSDRAEIAEGLLRLEGCEALALDAGPHELLTVFGWRLDAVRLASEPDQEAVTATVAEAGEVEVLERTATSVELAVPASASGDRILRLGEAHDERWSLQVDGVDAGPPIVVDGYATGWLLDGEAHQLSIRFGPQGAVEATFVASAISLVGVTALAVLPTGLLADRIRRRRSGSGAPS